MRPARSRRVQAQRKFAQGAYVPPNVPAVAAPENRRDAAQDARNVTVNPMSATGLLDVVSLQSATSQPERSGVHSSHLQSLPVVLLERLRGRIETRVQPSPSQRETVQPRPGECHRENVASIKIPAELPKLQEKKQKEYKRVHAMALRSRRLSKLELNKLIAESCIPPRKSKASKRKNVVSDDDEPLIFQKTRKKDTAEQQSSPKQIAARESTSKVNIAKQSAPSEKPPKKKLCKRKSREEITTNEIPSKEVKQKTAKQNTSQKTSAKKSSPQKKKSPQKRSPKQLQPARVAPEFSITVIKEDIMDVPVDLDVRAPRDEIHTPDDSVVTLALNDPLAPDVNVAPSVSVNMNDIIIKPIELSTEITDDMLSPLDNLPLHLDELMDSDDESDKDVRLYYDGDDSRMAPGEDRVDDSDVSVELEEDMMIKDYKAVQVGHREGRISSRLASPEPGPSGMQYQLSDKAVYSNHKTCVGNNLYAKLHQEVRENTVVKLDRLRHGHVEDVPTTCIAAELRSDQDVRNASNELLDSRCKVCKPCIRIEKLMTVSALLKTNIILTRQDNNAATLDNEETERDESGPEVIAINDIDLTHSEDKDEGYLYLDVPNHSKIMLKLRIRKVLGKYVLGVSWKPRKAFKNQQEFSLEEQEHVLDKLIETLKISQSINSESRNDILESRIDQNEITEDSNNDFEGLSILPDSVVTPEPETSYRIKVENQNISHHEGLATNQRLADAKLMEALDSDDPEKVIVIIQEKPDEEISETMAENSGSETRGRTGYSTMNLDREKELARLKQEIKQTLIAEMEANRRMTAEVDDLAKTLDKEKDAKTMYPEELPFDPDAPGTSGTQAQEGGKLVDAPVYYPSKEDFADPLLFYQKIWPEAVRFGICKVVPPDDWDPPFQMDDDLRFDVTNQYISRLFSRWGPAARELSAIKLCLQQHKVNFTRPPLLDGVEVNLPKLYHLVQRHGGLETVINKKRWGKVAEDMKFNKLPNTERRLDQIYFKYLLPYDTLSHQERQEIMRTVEIAWNRKNQKLLDRAMNPLHRQDKMLHKAESSDDETEDEDIAVAVHEAEDCIIKGSVMTRSKFKKIATMTYENIFGQGSEAANPPHLAEIEEHYWRHVTLGTEHLCVHTAAIDTGEEGHGFPVDKSEPYGSHPWNPKMISQNIRNVLRYLGRVLGFTVPTLLLGMLFATSCWHKDPHAIAWLEYQHQGPSRVWYGIPEHQADNFRKAVETLCPTSCQNKDLWLPSDITMIPPNVLREHNVTLSRVVQNEGEFILAFPNAYTCCISTGYTVSESVYFAPPSWLNSLWTTFKQTRQSCEPTMFAMEHLLYNIGKDPEAELDLLKIAQPLYDKMLREEVTNRQMLQERGLSFFQELLSANTSGEQDRTSAYSARDQDECEYCRATLYLSKVKGLTGKHSLLCLEHALKLLDCDKYKDVDLNDLQVVVHVSVKELNTVHDDMMRRLGIKGG